MVPSLPLPGIGTGSNSRMRKVSKSAALVRVVCLLGEDTHKKSSLFVPLAVITRL